jgi:hypothetical protein
MLTRTGLNFEVTLLSLDIGKFINLRPPNAKFNVNHH